ncbi:MAG: hypothetical protein GEU71_04020 [Actinobacteria bacterium]|nr:hypothetical protein [Actinomycetota bacterium]
MANRSRSAGKSNKQSKDTAKKARAKSDVVARKKKTVAQGRKKTRSRKNAGVQPAARMKAAAQKKDDTQTPLLFVVGEEERLERLVEGFGNNRVASLLEVSQSQPSRWRQGKERLGPVSRKRVLDLDYVLSRLLQIYPREQAEIWLTSQNSHLGGRPLDVLHLKGVGPLIEAIDAEAEGAFA